ncbi:outer membrane lipoprotein-sorting protein [Belliella kenyensis]|uniref:Outer membrane lipoprotein-sorting protein n=1 Tax=Belliella kenyensis TaxID=1472724 RepID=A0ABV8EGY7_9BACT|nr:outer membrane lipoprotein-sorting protein [Belliella kenyensis]MCH7403060.1 outer membrane lipoprotein-sorting protein [Belliella kenyensis]MDN3602229.1 outer membrane lipoprotein-sorting protein [Belliella kenyensis]
MKIKILLMSTAFIVGSTFMHSVFAFERSLDENHKIEAKLTLLEPEEVIAKYVEAVGGLENVKKIKTSYVSMVADFQGMKIETILFADSENSRLKQETKVMGEVQQKMILKDGKGYMEAGGQSQDLPEEMLAMIKTQTYVFPEPMYKDLGIELSLRGTEQVDGEEANVMILTLPNGMKTVEYYSTKSGLKLKTSSDAAGDMIYSDYKEVSGVLYPHTITMNSPMLPVPLETKIVKIELNKELNDEDFN